MALFRCGNANPINIVGSTENFFTFSVKRGTYQSGTYGNGASITTFNNNVPIVNYGTVATNADVYELTYSSAGKYLEFFSANGVTNMQIVQREIGDKFVVTSASYDVATMAISLKM